MIKESAPPEALHGYEIYLHKESARTLEEYASRANVTTGELLMLGVACFENSGVLPWGKNNNLDAPWIIEETPIVVHLPESAIAYCRSLAERDGATESAFWAEAHSGAIRVAREMVGF